jgi:UDP-glucose 4-epimerase
VKKICVVGSSGYIGSYLVNYLKKNYKLAAHSRKKILDINFYNNVKKIIIGDIKNKKVINKILNYHPDTIIYTISYNHFKSEKNLNESLRNNFEPFNYLISQIIKRNLKIKIIYFSTMQVYGREYKKKIINEDYPKNILNIYSLTHSMCEDLLFVYKNKISSHVVRLSNSFGMPILKDLNCWWPVLNDLCRTAKKYNKIIIKSDGSALRDFISLDDISNFVEILIRKKVKEQIINLCSSNTILVKELAFKIAKNKYFNGKKIPVIFKKKCFKKNKKSFFVYNNDIMKKYNFKINFSLSQQIDNFLRLI